jgi:RNA polymerase sigma-70 factor (ECF subfamily)
MGQQDRDLAAVRALAASGDRAAIARIFEKYRKRLRRIVAIRTNWEGRLQREPSDVVQDALADACRGLDDYLRDPRVPILVWLQQLVDARLHPVRDRPRGAGRNETADDEPANPSRPPRSSVRPARRLEDERSSSMRELISSELREGIRDAMHRLPQRDQQVLELRFFEHKSLADVASALKIGEPAARARLARALVRLRSMLDFSGF